MKGNPIEQTCITLTFLLYWQVIAIDSMPQFPTNLPLVEPSKFKSQLQLCGKAPGIDPILADVFKEGGPFLNEKLTVTSGSMEQAKHLRTSTTPQLITCRKGELSRLQ